MRFLDSLRKFNIVAIALLSALALGIVSLNLFWEWQRRNEEVESYASAFSPRVRAELIDGGDRKLTLYGKGELNGEFLTDLRFVDATDGTVTRLSADPATRFYNGQLVGAPGDGKGSQNYGYLVLSEVGEPKGEPLFDVLFLRFNDMRVFTLASKVLALDGPQELEGSSFSAVIWNGQNEAKFIRFSSAEGKIIVQRNLELQDRSQVTSGRAPVPRDRS